jgi:large subunit ribosomal protein L4
MARVDVLNCDGEKVKETDLPDEIFNVEVRADILHEVVRMQLARKRAGNACVKNRSEIRGSTKKLFRQKGTGRARRGNIKSPLLRGGGVTFGPKPKSYAFKVPKKSRRLALKMALSSKLTSNTLVLLDQLKMDRIKTRDFQNVMNNLNIKNGLIITDEYDETLKLSSRNVPKIKILQHEGLNVYDILKYNHLILLESALDKIGERFAAS